MKPKNILPLLFCLLISNNIHSQGKEYLDYIVTEKNDTIYGTFREKFFKTIFLENGKPHSLKEIKAYRYNDFVHVVDKKNEDGIYESFKNTETTNENPAPAKPDYIVNNSGDTIYGKISLPLISKYRVLTTNEKQKIKIKYPEVTSYREDNFIFYYKIREKFLHYDKEGDYLPLVYQGRGMNLYLGSRTPKIFYIEKDNKVLVLKWEIINEIFKDDKELMDLISKDVYSYDNIYLMMKFYARPK